MARVPYIPVPTAPVASPPARASDYQRIDVSPAAFGAQVGAATERAGEQIQQGTSELSSALLQRQNYYNEIAADNAVNNYQDTLTKLQYGDPNDPSKPGFYSLKGDAAMRAYQGVTAQAEQTRQQIRSQLNLPQQKAFDAASRRMQSYALGDMGRHYNQQLNTYSVQTQQDTVKLALRNIELNPQDDTGYQHNLADLERAQTRMDQSAGASPQVMAYNLDTIKAKAVSARTEALANIDATGAMTFLDANKDSVDPVTYSRLHTSLDKNIKTTSVDSAVHDTIANVNTDYRASGGATPSQQPGNSGAALLPVVRQLENSGDAAISPAGAVGRYQIMPGTAQQYGFDPAKLTDPTYNAQAATAILSDLSKRYQGDRDAVLVAYNAGPAVADRWLSGGRQNATLPAETQAYLSRANQIGTPAAATTPYKPLATYYQENYANIVSNAQTVAAQKWPNDPDLQDRYVTGITKNLNATIKAQEESNKADYGAVQAYVYKNNITTAAQLQGSPVNDQWTRLQENMPDKAHDLEQKIMKENTKKTAGIGAGFYGLFQKVVNGQITRPSDISSFVGEPMGVTTDGSKILTDVINAAQTPQGHADLSALGNILNWAHGEISKTDPATGTIDAKGDENFQKYLALAVPTYFSDLKKGITRQQIFDLKSQHSITSLVAQFKPTKEGGVADYFKIEPGAGFTAGGQQYEAGSPTAVGATAGEALGTQAATAQLDVHDPNAVAQAFMHGKISLDQLQQIIKPHPEWWSNTTSAPPSPSAPLTP